MKVFKKTALLLSVIVLAVVLSIGVIAGVAQAAEGSATLGEEYAAVQVTTDGKVNLKVFYSALGEAESFKVEVVDPVTGATNVSNVAAVADEKTGNYVVKVPLTPSQMTHTVKVTATAGDKEGSTQTFTVADYAKEVLADASLSAYHDAMRMLLNWGAMAQNFFEDATDAPANANLFAKSTNPVNAVDASSIVFPERENNDDAFKSANLELTKGNITMSFTADLGTEVSEEDVFAMYYRDGLDDWVEINVAKVDDNGLYKISIANISVQNWDKIYTLYVIAGDAEYLQDYSVFEYLNYQAANGNAAVKNVVKAMYQFYQAATGNVNADCAHGKRDTFYWANVDADSAVIKCAFCHAQLSNVAVNNAVNEYIPGSLLQFGSKTGSTDVTAMSENGKQFGRVDNMWANRDGWGDIGLANVLSSNTVTGQYMVIKYRIGTEGNASTYIELFANTNLGAEKNLTGKAGTKILNSAKGEWVTAVIDLSERVVDPSVAFLPAEDGSYDIQYLSLRLFPYAAQEVTDDSAEGRYVYVYKYTKSDNTAGYEVFNGARLTEDELAEKVAGHADYALFKIRKMTMSADAYVDVAYIAFSDDLADLKALVDTDTYVKSVADDKNEYYYTIDDSCTHYARNMSETLNGSTYTYGVCEQCGDTYYTKTLADSVKLYFAPWRMATSGGHETNPRVHFQLASTQFIVEPGNAYVSYNGAGKTGQVIWNRGPGVNGYGAGNAQDYTMDSGKASYAVVKMRVNEKLAKNPLLYYGTTGVDGQATMYIPTDKATAGEWATYVIDLAKVAGSQHALDAESGNYEIDTLYFHLESLTSTAKIDIAYMAFVEGDWSEIDKTVDTETAIYVYASGKGVNVDPATGLCAGGDHVATMKVIDGVYKYTCDSCGALVKDYGVVADEIGLYWPAEKLHEIATNRGQSPYWSSFTGTYNQVEVMTEDGETFLRLGDAVSNKATNGAWGGWFPMASTSASTSGQNRYMVIKVRRNSNVSGLSILPMWINSVAANTSWDKGGMDIVLGQDNTWHTIVVDLAVRSSTYYTPDENGGYDPKNIHIRPFGSGSAYDATTDETFDIAYMAFFDDLSDIPMLVAEETYEFAKSGTENIVLVTATGACKACSPTYVADSTDPRGYHFECSTCGKKFGIDLYVQAAKGYNGGNDYKATITPTIDKAGFSYNAIEFTGTYGTMMNFTNVYYGGSNMYTSKAVMAGRFLVLKLKGSVPEGGTLPICVATDDNGVTGGGNPKQTAIGNFTASNMPSEWTVVVLDLANTAGYSDGEIHKIVVSTATGDGGTASKGVKLDLAYVAAASTLEDIAAFAEGENIMFYGDSVSNDPIDFDELCDGTKHTYQFATAKENGVITNTATCLVCGNKKVQTVSAEINYFADLNNMNKYQHNLSKNLFDAENGVIYNRYYGNGGNHLNITGGGGAGSATSATYKTGKYVAIKYRATGFNADGTIGTTNFGFNVATGDKKSGNGVGLGTQFINTVDTSEWRVAVLDVSRAAQWTYDGSMQTIYIMLTVSSSVNYTFDVAWVAVVDSVEEARTLLTDGETYFDYKSNSWATEGLHLNKDGTCVSCKGLEGKTGNTYTYTCEACGTLLKSFKIGESVTRYYSTNDLNTTANVYYGGSHSYQYDAVNNVPYMQTSVIQTIWQRMDHDMAHSQTAATAEQYVENVGNAKYLVIKARKNTESSTLYFNISTSAKNCQIGTVTEANLAACASYKKIMEDGSTDTALCTQVGDQYYTGTAIVGVYLFGNSDSTSEWTTYVIDLETVCDGFYEKVEGQDYYEVDSFYLQTASGSSVDVAYAAFVEGGWAEIADLVDEDVVMEITGHGNSTAAAGELVNVADKMASVEVDKGMEFSAKTLYDNLNAFNVDKSYDAANEAVTVIGKGEASWSAYIYEKWVNGANAYENINIGKARYLVVNVKVSDAKFRVRFNASMAGINGDWVVANLDATTEWQTFVIDLQTLAGANWKADTNGDYVLDRLTLFASQHGSNTKYTITASDSYSFGAMCFCENWDQIAAYLGGNGTALLVNKNDGNVEVNVADGSAVQ